jgi:hypothetical protein
MILFLLTSLISTHSALIGIDLGTELIKVTTKIDILDNAEP